MRLWQLGLGLEQHVGVRRQAGTRAEHVGDAALLLEERVDGRRAFRNHRGLEQVRENRENRVERLERGVGLGRIAILDAAEEFSQNDLQRVLRRKTTTISVRKTN